MSTHKHIDKICCVVLALVLLLTVWFVNAERFGIQAAATVLEYEERLFDTSFVHTIDIVMDDWEGFLDTCENEEYTLCSVVIDNESCGKVAIRAKGNTSLSTVSSYGNDRYSFKLEFDHYDSANTYYGLDKLSLNNIIQDNTYMKDFLSYQMMGAFGVNAPLCSYAYITVNGEDWGLYLAVEGVEESFLTRNYGNGYGELYKPDSTSMGGGRGNGGDFSMGALPVSEDSADTNDSTALFGRKGGNAESDSGSTEQTLTPPEDISQNDSSPSLLNGMGKEGGMGGRSTGDSDVSLIYTDDEYESYSNIFDNAKTDVTDADKDRLIAALKTINEGGNIESAVDADEVIRYFIVHNFVCNFDSYTGSMIHNYYLYEEDGKLSMIPWDYNLAFGGFQSAGSATDLVNYPIDTPVSGGTVDSRPMLAWIFNSEEYTSQYHALFAEWISSYFDSGIFEEFFDAVSAMIAPYVQSDPTKFCTYDEFVQGAETLRSFCLLRAESISGQLDGSIPSTSDGQQSDSSSLIDASSLTISDMGSMGNAGGKAGDRIQTFTGLGVQWQTNETTDEPDRQNDAADSQNAQPPEGFSQEANGSPPEMPGVQNGADFSGGMQTPPRGFGTDDNALQMPGMPEETASSDEAPSDTGKEQEGLGENGETQQDMQQPNEEFDGFQNNGGAPANGFPAQNPSAESSGTSNFVPIILLGVSVLILAGGIIFALKFKR